MDYIRKGIRLVREVYRLFFITDFNTFARYIWAIFSSLPKIFLVGNLGPAYDKMEGRDYTFSVLGKPVILNGRYFGRVTELYARGVYFMPPEFVLREGMDVVFDLGANTGTFTMPAGKFAKRVIAVEAEKRLIKELEENARVNGISEKIETVWGLVGGDAGMFADPNVRREFFGGDIPPSFSFAELLNKYGIVEVDYLKADIEGSEFDLFQNEMNSFKNVKLIAMEIHVPFFVSGNEIPCGDILKLKKFFEDANFKVWLLDVNQRVVADIKGQAGYLFAKNLRFRNN